jgi:CO/xanthine dehydrogenase Mo-binding subunit
LACALSSGSFSVSTVCAQKALDAGLPVVVVAGARPVIGCVLLFVVTAVAGRQAWMSGGAILGAALAIRRRLDAGERGVIEETFEHHHRPTAPPGERGQGNTHVAFAFAAHRAVVDVDLDLGLVRVVEIATSQDVGRVLNPIQVLGQIERGDRPGVGLAVMEEVLVTNGVVRNASFTDYLIPTALDMPEVSIAALIEQPRARSTVRGQGRWGGADDLVVGGRRVCHSRCHWPRPNPHPDQARGHSPAPCNEVIRHDS